MTLGLGSMSQEFAPGGKDWCREHYWHLRMEEKQQPSLAAAIGTILGIMLYILLEYATHYGPEYIAVRKTPEITAETDLELLQLRPTTQVSGPDDEVVIKYLESTWVPECTPGAHTRATRLAQAIFIYLATLVIFVLRIHGALDVPYVPEACVDAIGLEGRDWVAISIFNIVPFALATLAFLRPVIDCVLVRWGTHLGNGRGKRGAMLWPPCPPLAAILYTMIIGGYVLFEFVRWHLTLAMTGRTTNGNSSGNGVQERRVEEESGLVANIDGGDHKEEGGEEPPAYEATVGIKGAH